MEVTIEFTFLSLLETIVCDTEIIYISFDSFLHYQLRKKKSVFSVYDNQLTATFHGETSPRAFWATAKHTIQEKNSSERQVSVNTNVITMHFVRTLKSKTNRHLLNKVNGLLVYMATSVILIASKIYLGTGCQSKQR